MAYSDESDYKYVEGRDSVPVSGSDIGQNWSNSRIDNAVEDGETKLESDVNEGREISNPEHIHGQAAATWATYRLVLGFKSPDSATRGDSLDEGGQRMDYAKQLKEDYYDYVQSITSAEGDESEGGSGSVAFEVADWNDRV